MRCIFTIPLALVALSVVACGAKQTPEPVPEPEVPITLTTAGISPAPQTPISQASIAAAFDGYDVVGDESRYAVRWHGATMVLIDGTADGGYMVKAVDARVEGPDGLAVGDDFGRLTSRGDVQCRRGQGDWVGLVYCTLPALKDFTFAFELDTGATPGCGADCVLESLDPLAGAKIDFIDWMPR